MLIPSHIKDSYFYEQWYSKKNSMKEIFNSFNDESNYQNSILRHYFPTLNEKLLDIYQLFCVNPCSIFDLDDKEKKELNNYQEYIKNINKDKNVNIELLKTSISNNLILIMLNLWFKIRYNYSNFLYRYVIPQITFCRYQNIYELLNDEYHDEPFIIQKNEYEYDVVYKKNYYYCNGDIFKAIHLWFRILTDRCNSEIKTIKFHTKPKNILHYYPWINVWYQTSKNQVLLFKKDLLKKDSFFDSLTNDKLKINELFFNDFIEVKNDINIQKKDNSRTLTDEELKKFINDKKLNK